MIRITIGMGSCGIAAGAEEIYDTFLEHSKKNNDIEIVKVGCIGICQYEPLVEIYKDNERTTYINVKAEDVSNIIEEHVIYHNIVSKLLIEEKYKNITEVAYYKKQIRIALRNCGIINPENIDEYIKINGYKGLSEALSKKPNDIIDELKNSNLRGRGGAGFSTGKKWELANLSKSEVKYVCCNADEGDPGSFMDRAILEGDPHSVIEAMIIAGFVTNSNQGYIYVRAEYPLAIKRLEIAIEQAYSKQFLGTNILGTGFCFDLSLRLGSGAFVCGEETALISSIEGKRGEPKVRPPFPTDKGIFSRPTLINNVETYANIVPIILNGSKWFKSIGTNVSGGTKVFALSGKIVNTGLIEIPIGSSLKEIIYDIGGGIPNNKKFKAAQIGGPSGGCIPGKYIDITIDYETLIEAGAMMGSGGLIIMDEDTCMVDIAKFFLDFTVDESCGQCIPCRIGTQKLLEILKKITDGLGKETDLHELKDLSAHVRDTSFCGLGYSAPNPILSTILHFENEYIEHVKDKNCKARNCKNLMKYIIEESKCIGCGICLKECPVNAIEGVVKTPHIIDQSKCIKCGICFEKCKFDAIEIAGGIDG